VWRATTAPVRPPVAAHLAATRQRTQCDRRTIGDARKVWDDTLRPSVARRPPAGRSRGRDHWSQAYSAIFAGGGFARGDVVGKTDRFAGEVTGNPVSPKDILATVYHLLGIPPETLIQDALNRPYPIAESGVVRRELLA
jgi:hypothetical protein